MHQPQAIGHLDHWVEVAVRSLAFVGGLAVLLAMAALTCADIILRHMGFGIPASWEIVTFAMRWMIGLSLPYGFYASRHVAVEAFTDWLPPRGRLGFVILGEVAGLVAMSVLTWRLTIRGMDILGYGTRTSDLGIYEFWHWFPLILGAGLSAIVLAFLLIRDLLVIVSGRSAQ